MTLSQKTQNRVPGWSAGVLYEVVSGLRSHGFGAMEDDAGKETMCLRSQLLDVFCHTDYSPICTR